MIIHNNEYNNEDEYNEENEWVGEEDNEHSVLLMIMKNISNKY